MCDETKNELALQQVLDDLRKPFHPSQVTWKPGAVKGERALALAYADLRAYMNRLDEVCGTNWSVAYEPWGEDRIICRLTIMGVTRSSTGETTNEAERSEIGGTVAEAQAFKRASAMFGLGRYLYNLPTGWADFDPASKRFTDKAKARLMGILVQQYRRATDVKSEMADLFALDEEQEAAETAQKPVNGKHSANGASKAARNGAHENENGYDGNSAHESALNGAPDIESALNGASNMKKEVAPELAPLFAEFNALGQDLYGEQWEKVCSRNVARISGGKAKYSAELTGEQMQQLITGMMKVKSNRMPVAVPS